MCRLTCSHFRIGSRASHVSCHFHLIHGHAHCCLISLLPCLFLLLFPLHFPPLPASHHDGQGLHELLPPVPLRNRELRHPGRLHARHTNKHQHNTHTHQHTHTPTQQHAHTPHTHQHTHTHTNHTHTQTQQQHTNKHHTHTNTTHTPTHQHTHTHQHTRTNTDTNTDTNTHTNPHTHQHSNTHTHQQHATTKQQRSQPRVVWAGRLKLVGPNSVWAELGLGLTRSGPNSVWAQLGRGLTR